MEQNMEIEFKGYGGEKVIIEGNNVLIKQLFIKEECTFDDIISICFTEPFLLQNGRLDIKTRTHRHSIFFLKKDVEKFTQLFNIITERNSEVIIEDLAEKAAAKEAVRAEKLALCCPKSRMSNINVQMVQESFKTETKHKSIIKSLGRGAMIVGTVGLWALTPKQKESSKGKFNIQKMAICQNCGFSWKV